MCGIAGVINIRGEEIPALRQSLRAMNDLQAHRGPDGCGTWVHDNGHLGFAHRRLSIIDLAGGAQPMQGSDGSWIVFNGEIYNYKELRSELGVENFRSSSDTEVILEAYRRWGCSCVDRFKGMFAFAIWDERKQTLFCARDRVGIKPFYFARVGDCMYFASEVKALLPFLATVEVDHQALKDYLYFQFYLGGRTLFKNVEELAPATFMTVKGGFLSTKKYWDCHYRHDTESSDAELSERISKILDETTILHARSDVPMGGYVSGGLDSSIISALMRKETGSEFIGITGKFSESAAYDESKYARALAKHCDFELVEVTIKSSDFVDNVEKLAYFLDFPVAGPGSFNQFMVSREAGKRRKVMIGGQGGDEIFGGYARYLVGSLEQSLRRAIDVVPGDKNPQEDLLKMLPHLPTLREYKPMMREFFSAGLFDTPDERYFRLIQRAPELGDQIRWSEFGDYSPLESYLKVFRAENVASGSFIDRMTNFDFKTLLPGLLHIEDRVTMAHGIESRVPLLDHELIELAATLPFEYKYRDGVMKYPLREAAKKLVPNEILTRTDKMGFPIPLNEWIGGELNEFVRDIFSSSAAKSRPFWDHGKVLQSFGQERQYGRRTWGLLNLELWHRGFIDQSQKFQARLREFQNTAPAISGLDFNQSVK